MTLPAARDEIPQVWYSMQQAATYANVSLSTIKRAVASGELRSSRRRVRRIRREWIDEWLERAPDAD